MEIELVELPTETLYRLRGRFDAHVTSQFKAITANPQRSVQLDLEGVGFIDSSGLAALVSLYRRCREAGFNLRIVHVQDAVRLIFEITQLAQVLPVEFSEAA